MLKQFSNCGVIGGDLNKELEFVGKPSQSPKIAAVTANRQKKLGPVDVTFGRNVRSPHFGSCIRGPRIDPFGSTNGLQPDFSPLHKGIQRA
jgi:hypothetical protein